MNRLGILDRLESELKTLIRFLVFIAVLVVAAPLLLAQWPLTQHEAYPEPPGQPDLTAPAPRTADGKPDLSGIWDNGRNTNGPQVAGHGAAVGQEAPTPTPRLPLQEPLPLQMRDLRTQRSLMSARGSAKACRFSPGPQNS